jgi:hypothetical protein
MPEHRIELSALTLRAAVTPDSINADERTVDVIFATGAAVPRYDWRTDTKYQETLSLKPDQIRLARLNNSAPFLDSHSGAGLGSMLGVVVPGSATVVGGTGRATVRFSRRADVEPVWQDVRDGIIRNVSVGYVVHKYEEREGKAGALPMRHAVDWEPYEISAVPMGADDGAKVRGADHTPTNPCVIWTRDAKETVMDDERQEAAVPLRSVTSIQTTNGTNGTTGAEDLGAPELNERAEGTAEEKRRISGILNGCEAARLPMSYARKLIDEGHGLEKAQGMILDTLRGRALDDKGPRQGPSAVQVVGADPLENVWRGITGALLHRIDSRFALDDNARQYRTHSLLRTAEECLEQRGIRTRGMSKDTIASLAFAPTPGIEYRSGLHTTSDFATILADVANKSLRRAYDEAPQTFSVISRQIEMPDFKPVKRTQIGEAPALAKILEHGEFTRGTVAEGKEQFSLSTYGRMFGITRRALVNDDLDAFGRMTTAFGRSARNLESDLVWAEILRNANMGDGIPLFNASHGNLAAAAAAIDVTSLGIGRAAMRAQKGLDGATYLNISARYLVVPPGKETIADQYTTAISPALGGSVNPFAGRLTVVSEPRLEGGITLQGATPEVIAGSTTAWYLAADPGQIDIVEYGYLAGQVGPSIESRNGWDIDGLEIRCRHDFAAKVIDYRGLFKNAGL